MRSIVACESLPEFVVQLSAFVQMKFEDVGGTQLLSLQCIVYEILQLR